MIWWVNTIRSFRYINQPLHCIVLIFLLICLFCILILFHKMRNVFLWPKFDLSSLSFLLLIGTCIRVVCCCCLSFSRIPGCCCSYVSARRAHSVEKVPEKSFNNFCNYSYYSKLFHRIFSRFVIDVLKAHTHMHCIRDGFREMEMKKKIVHIQMTLWWRFGVLR